jgi:hypothetical protein
MSALIKLLGACELACDNARVLWKQQNRLAEQKRNTQRDNQRCKQGRTNCNNVSDGVENDGRRKQGERRCQYVDRGCEATRIVTRERLCKGVQSGRDKALKARQTSPLHANGQDKANHDVPPSPTPPPTFREPLVKKAPGNPNRNTNRIITRQPKDVARRDERVDSISDSGEEEYGESRAKRKVVLANAASMGAGCKQLVSPN